MKKEKAKFSKIFDLASNKDTTLRVYVSTQKAKGEGYLARLSKLNKNWRSHFVYDFRTKTIRIARLRHLALSNQAGMDLKPDQQAVFRRLKGGGTKDQILTYGKDDMVRNAENQCLTPVKRQAKDEADMTWEKCGEHDSQLFLQNFIDKENKKLEKQPPPKKFSLVNPKGWRIYISSKKQGTGFEAKISSESQGWRQEFTFDPRTRSIRVASLSTMALSNQVGMGLKEGKKIAFRTYNGAVDQFVKSGGDRILNKNDQCLTATRYKLEEGGTLSWWKCSPLNNPKKSQIWKTNWMIELKKGTLKWNKKLTPIHRDRFKTKRIPRRPKKIYPEGKPANAGANPAAPVGAAAGDTPC